MKPFKLFGALLVVTMLLGLLTSCVPAAPAAPAVTKFTIASDASWPPMEFVDANKNVVGFDIDLINAIAVDQKFEVEIKNTAWDGIFAGLEGGAYDAILSSVTITDDRKKTYDFSDPYFDANQGIVVRMDDNIMNSEQDLAGKTVGAQIGTTGAIHVSDNLKDATLKQYDTPDLAMMDLVNKNIDAVIVDTPVAANYALQAEQFKGKLKMAFQIVTEERYGLTVQKGDPKKILPLFNAGLKNIQASGEYDKIYQKWIGGTK